MFTGIVEQTGLVRGVQLHAGGMRIDIDLGTIAQGTKLGDSICVNGVCLTVSGLKGSSAVFDVSPETLRRSTLGRFQNGRIVNLERALRADGRFGGHFVQGHVDGLGRIAAIRRVGEFAEFRIETSAELLSQMVQKGSVAADGISLTVASLDQKGFTAVLIPATLSQTSWKQARVGDEVNIETDILVKIVQSLLGRSVGRSEGLAAEKLRLWGYCADGE
jgi:riboflavin synthase